jgi:CBS-domain-containing membrane protein
MVARGATELSRALLPTRENATRPASANRKVGQTYQFGLRPAHDCSEPKHARSPAGRREKIFTQCSRKILCTARGSAAFSPAFSMSAAFRKSHIAFATLGAVLGVSAVAYCASTLKGLMLLGSFGASALLLFALPEAPLSQPRSVLLGHVGASAIALGCLACFGPQWWAIGLATGLGVGYMMATRTVHPPAASNAIVVFLAKPGWVSCLGSTVGGTILLIAIAFFYHRATGRHRYPLQWRAAAS